ncbi:retrovirus-related pol polyprotein LINE-1 [Tanacetum coccineum]
MAQVHQAAQGFTDAEWDDVLTRVVADEDFVQQLFSSCMAKPSIGRIEAIDSDGHLRSCPFSLGGVDELLELGYALGRHKVDIACFQETKWKGSITWEGNGYKLWYSGSRTARNGVGVILAARLKDKIVQVKRSSDMIMTISVVIEGDTISVISAYAPHVGLSDVEKKSFWDALDELVRECPPDERLIIGGDLNGYIGLVTDEYTGVHEGYGFEVWNEEGCAILEFVIAHDLVVANFFFKKSDAHLITF